jgi:hypothetical protein
MIADTSLWVEVGMVPSVAEILSDEDRVCG